MEFIMIYLFVHDDSLTSSPVKWLEDPKQIATQILFWFSITLDLYYKHTKSIPESEDMKFDFFHHLCWRSIFISAKLQLELYLGLCINLGWILNKEIHLKLHLICLLQFSWQKPWKWVNYCKINFNKHRFTPPTNANFRNFVLLIIQIYREFESASRR